MKAIVVSFDHLPVGFLGLHGNTWVDTPAFDRLAAEGVVFERHLAAAVGEPAGGKGWWSARREDSGDGLGTWLRSANVRTTLLEEGPGDRRTPAPVDFDEVRAVDGVDGLDTAADVTPFGRLVAEAGNWLAKPPEGDWLLWLKSRGVPSPWLPPRELGTRYVALFEELEDDFDELEGIEGVGPGDENEWDFVGAGEPEAFEEDDWESALGLDDSDEGDEDAPPEEGDRPVAEEDFDEAAEFDELLVALASVGERGGGTDGLETADWLLVRAVYGGYVALLDRGLGELRRRVGETLGDDVLLIVTGGEGESLGERAELPPECDALGIGEEVVHTPLLVHGPGLRAGSRSTALAQTIDVAPTLLEWFGLSAAPDVEGRSILPLARGEAGTEHESLVVTAHHGVRGLRTEDRYLVHAPNDVGDQPDDVDVGTTKLFVKPDDVWDLHDVAAQEPDTTEELLSRLQG